MKVDFKEMAKVFMFSKESDSAIVSEHKLQFRKGKTLHDIRYALVKARKKGKFKTEFELGMLELYLADVFMKRAAK